MPYSNNKWGKHLAMKADRELASLLPPTSLATKANIKRMLAKHQAVYLKPSHGTGGYGISKLSRVASGYRLQNGTRSRSFATLDGVYAAFEKTKTKRTYLVQKGLPLLRYKSRPFDLRIMVQRNPKRQWEVTGIVGRLAHPAKIVTNYHSGGKPMPISQLLTPYMNAKKQTRYLNHLRSKSLRISSRLNKVFPRFRSYGVDIGIDNKLQPWIIEVNTRPDKSIFNTLTDKRMYRKIIHYAKLNGHKA